MKSTHLGRYRFAVPLLLLLIASAVVYLPRMDQIGYLNDDWYLMYSAHAHGAQVFPDIYSIDRPARALVLTPAYMLFGDKPLYYNLSAYLFRLLSGMGFFWLLQMIWPNRRTATFIAALLFLMYPGFLSQLNGIDYQSQMVSLASAMLSIALSVQAVLTKRPLVKALGFFGAVVLGWLYLGLVEYFLGLELLRFAGLYIVAGRNQAWGKEKLAAAMRSWLPNLIIPCAFLVWRLFVFESERGATDLGAQLEQFRALPLATATWWLVRLLSNAFHVAFLAWGIPLYQFLPYISRLPDLLIALACAGLLLILLVWFLKPLHDQHSDKPRRTNWKTEVLLLGIVTAIAGLVPVILVNRQADFWDYSRYTLASSPGSALILTAVLFSFSSRALRWGMLALLVAVAVFTHHANAIRLAAETESLRAFWWQVAWRVPQLRMDTTLVVNYPITVIQEDYFVWGPANLLYYPDGVGGEELRTGVSAAVLNKYSLLKIISDGGREHTNRRSIRSVIDYENILVMSMPITGSCVQVIDGSQPELSQYEEERVMLIASYSDLANIDLDSEPRLPLEIVFGPEPVRGWCYFYEKADLARQRGDWNEVLRLGNEALDQGLAPGDSIEWMPFLQAYARTGDAQRLDEVRRLMRSADPFVIQQVCVNLNRMPELSEQVIPVVISFCNE